MEGSDRTIEAEEGSVEMPEIHRLREWLPGPLACDSTGKACSDIDTCCGFQ
jgi:hypothetical protein